MGSAPASTRLRGLLPGSVGEALPGVAMVRSYRLGSLRSDLVAGTIVAVVAVPASLAMAELAGLPVVYGLYGTFLPLVGYAVFGSSRQLVVGPEATMATLTAATVAPLAVVGGETDPALYAALAAGWRSRWAGSSSSPASFGSDSSQTSSASPFCSATSTGSR